MRPDPEMPTCVYGLPRERNIKIRFYEHEGKRYVEEEQFRCVHTEMEEQEGIAARARGLLKQALILLGQLGEERK